MQSNPTSSAARMIPVAGHPGIYRRGGRYVVVWRDRGHQRKRSFRTLTEATRHKGRTAAGDTAAGSRERLDAYARRWLDTYQGRTHKGISDATRASYRDALERVVLPYFARVHPSLRLEQIRPTDLRDLIAELRDHGYAPSSVRRVYAPLRALLATAHEDGLIVHNPAAGLRVVVPATRPVKPRLTPEQTRKLLGEMPADHADLAFVLAATGLRIGEALGLRWGDLGHEDGRPVLRVRRVTTKTDAGERVVPISPETARRLTRRRAEVDYPGGDDPIFASMTGQAIDAHNYRRRVFRPAAERAGVQWATPHALRHGMATLIAEQGFTPAQIAAHLGHADGGVLALKTYVRTRGLRDLGFVDEALHGSAE